MPADPSMYLIDVGLVTAYAILITQALAGVVAKLPLSRSDPVEGL